jgi:pimeloyl-ACP methyl ester carboxylesterase
MKNVPCLILASGADEAVPPELQDTIGHMAQRLAAAMGPAASAATINAAPHNCEGHEAQVAEAVQGWLQKLPAGT